MQLSLFISLGIIFTLITVVKYELVVAQTGLPVANPNTTSTTADNVTDDFSASIPNSGQQQQQQQQIPLPESPLQKLFK